MYNTPPTWGIYIIGLVLEWIKNSGGLAAIEKRNREKAALLYDYLDASPLFYSPVEKSCRSLMNIPFVFRASAIGAAGDEKRAVDSEKKAALEKKFVAEAAAAGLVNLAGHRLVGGMRASIYNAMPIEGVRALLDFMKEFEVHNV
jgi:phosphoserine aminotransferase